MKTQQDQFKHWQETGKYLYEGIEYVDVPHELQIDTSRGVIYLNNLISCVTVLRVCRIPLDLAKSIDSGTLVIDIINTPSSMKRAPGKAIKKQPVFLKLSGSESMMDMKTPPTGDFQINDEAGLIYCDFRNVPGNLLYDLWMGRFVDITLGFTGVLKS